MDKHVILRNEEERDWPAVERLTRRAFYNLYIPGCVEHYLAKRLRSHPDFIPELDLVLELEGQVIANVMYTKNRLVDEGGEEREILTFGPLCVAPEHQRKGYGRLLLEGSFQRAAELGYDTVVIFGDPANYMSRGFKSCKKYNVALEGTGFPAAMLVKELRAGALDGRRWYYRQSAAYEMDEAAARAYDDALPEKLEKKWLPCQEAFEILSQAVPPEGPGGLN